MKFFTKTPRYPTDRLFPCVSEFSNEKHSEGERFDIDRISPEKLILKLNLKHDGRVGFYTAGFFDEDGLEYSILCLQDWGPFIYLMDANGESPCPLDPYESKYRTSVSRFIKWLLNEIHSS